MSNFKITINNVILDGVVDDVIDNEILLGYKITLITRPAHFDNDGKEIENPYEGFTAVKKYRLNLAGYNPKTLNDFADKSDVIEFCINSPENYFSPWFDDPVEKDDGE